MDSKPSTPNPSAKPAPAPAKPGTEDKYLVIKKNWCKRCGICISVCPKQVIERLPNGVVEIVHLDRCITCGMCVLHCPDFAIFGDPKEYELCKDR